MLRLIGFEGWGKCFDDGTCTEIATSDTDAYDIVAALLEVMSSLFYRRKIGFADLDRQVDPA